MAMIYGILYEYSDIVYVVVTFFATYSERRGNTW